MTVDEVAAWGLQGDYELTFYPPFATILVRSSEVIVGRIQGHIIDWYRASPEWHTRYSEAYYSAEGLLRSLEDRNMAEKKENMKEKMAKLRAKKKKK